MKAHKIISGLALTWVLATTSGIGLVKAQTALEATTTQSSALAFDGTNVTAITLLNDTQLTSFINTLNATPTIPATSLQGGGTFWSLQNPNFPPLPVDTSGSAVWPLADGSLLLNDVDYDYSAASTTTLTASPMGMGMMTMSAESLPALPGDSSTNTYTPNNLSGSAAVGGTNLWIAQTAVTNGYLAAIGTNTVADVAYTILSVTNLLQVTNGWQNEGMITGSELTNWTPFSVAQSNRANLFVRLRSEQSSDGSGLPDWWELLYFGTNNVDPYGNPKGDGYNNYYKFEYGMNPNQFYTPVAPQNFTLSYNKDTGAVTLNWLPSQGTITGYSLQKTDYQTGQSSTISLSATAVSYADSVAGEQPQYGGPVLYLNYDIQAEYGAYGNSASASVDLQSSSPLSVNIASGPSGSLNIIAQNLPGDLQALRIYRNSQQETFYGIWFWPYGFGSDYPADFSDDYFSIPAAAITNGITTIPASQVKAFGKYGFWVQAVRSNGVSSAWADLSGGFIDNTFVDARRQMKDDIRFLLCVASEGGPIEINQNIYATNYVCSSFQLPNTLLNPLAPIDDNYAFRNLVFDGNNLAITGTNDALVPIFSSPGMPNGVYSGFGLFFINPTYVPDYASLVSTNIPVAPTSLLNANQTKWLYSGQYLIDPWDPVWPPPYLTVNAGTNAFGLRYLSDEIVIVTNNTQFNFLTGHPGDHIPVITTVEYPQTEEPQLQFASYYFARIGIDPFPEQNTSTPYYTPQSLFAVTNTTPIMFAGVGQSMPRIAGYAKYSIANDYTNMFAYLGQYFEKAYQVNTNGVVTANTTGVLSPYGDFYATTPGPAALVTMPDIDTGQQGTCTVYCVSLQLDKNHDGIMDTSFNGPDATSSGSPFVIWSNDNYDRWALDKDDGTNYMDDVDQNSMPAAGCPYTPNTPTPDYNYCNQYGLRQISCTRDLQDFFRLWVCGITPSLLTNLPSGSTVTLDWGDVGNPDSGNPTIDLFQAVEANGGIGYQTNETIATQQINPAYSSHVGRLGPGQSIQLNSSYWSGWAGDRFLMCGVSNGTGGLNLTIKDGNGNVLAQSTSYIQIVNIKQMYERWTVGENPNIPPLTVATNGTEDLPIGVTAFQYPKSTDTNTPYILYVHGWNMDRYDKDRFAESAFKRLYWQGYHGRFGIFRWPTDHGFTGDFSQLLSNPQQKDNFDNSENNAWLASVGLLNKLNDLNAEYPGHVYVLAHSMGNIVASESLRRAGNNQVVNTYVASQAAVSAQTYDATVSNFSFLVNLGGVNVSFGPHTPNIYGNWFAGNNGGGAGLVINFYNVNDYALSRLHWQLDQLFKPDVFVASGGALWNYEYGGSTSDPAPWNYFFKTNVYNNARVNFDIVNSLAANYEVFSHAAQSYTTALGATTGVNHHLSEAVDLTSIWLAPDPLQNNYASHFWHSAEFRGDNPQQRNYWSELLGPDGFNINWPLP